MAIATVAIFALLVTPALGDADGNGKGGGKGGGSTSGTSSIELEEYSEYYLGGEVGFATNGVGLAGWEYPMVAIPAIRTKSRCTCNFGNRMRNSSSVVNPTGV